MFTVPWEIAFSIHGNEADSDTSAFFHKYLDLVFDFFFFLDLIITFKVAYITSEFNILDDRKAIAKQYFSTWFFVDFLACIPYGTVSSIFLSSNQV